MRSDLNKVLCEHERSMSSDSFKNYRHLKNYSVNRSKAGEELENLPTREKMKQRYGWDTKNFGEHLNPLYGAVHKAVGRPWNKFYSDLCKNFDKRSVINQHILLHLRQYVELDGIFVGEDGELYVQNTYSGALKLKDSGTEYYVDPRDGIIKRNKWYRSYRSYAAERAEERKREEAKVFRKLDEKNVLRFINGVWYHFTLEEVPSGKFVYYKPTGKTEFNVTPSWARHVEPKMKKWEELNQSEKERLGVRTVSGNTVTDVFTEQVLVNVNGSVQTAFGGIVKDVGIPKNMYHATKKTASHKLLKKAGIV